MAKEVISSAVRRIKERFTNQVRIVHRDLDDEDLKALAAALKGDEHVQHIDLEYNDIQNAGVQALVECLMDNKSVTALLLYGNAIDIEGHWELAKLQALRPELDIRGTWLTKEKIEEAKLDGWSERIRWEQEQMKKNENSR